MRPITTNIWWLSPILTLCLLTYPFIIEAQIAQEVEISSSPNPVGSGARAIGMGGAFIAIVDDATAASWNPGGLTQLETPEISLAYSFKFRKEETFYNIFSDADNRQNITLDEINYGSIAYPFILHNHNIIVSLNLQHLYDFNSTVRYRFSQTFIFPPGSETQEIKKDITGAFKPLSPAIAIRLTPSLSVGTTINFWNHPLLKNGWNSLYHATGIGNMAGFAYDLNINVRESYKTTGLKIDRLNPASWQNVNCHLGLLWNINEHWQLGAVLKTPFEINMRHDYLFQSTITWPSLPASNVSSTLSRHEEIQLVMPMSYGVGLAARISDTLTFGFDLYHTQWSKYLLRDGSGEELNPLTSKTQAHSHIVDTTQVRLGCEYLLISPKYIIPFRGGIFYDPEPAEYNPDNFFGFSVGSGIAYKNIIFDAAYTYRFAKNVRNTSIDTDHSSMDINQQTFLISTIYHF